VIESSHSTGSIGSRPCFFSRPFNSNLKLPFVGGSGQHGELMPSACPLGGFGGVLLSFVSILGCDGVVLHLTVILLNL
jgi:hypothetical protein